MIEYTYEKQFNDIVETDTNFVIIFTNDQKTHYDSVVVPRFANNDIDFDSLNQKIDELVQYVSTKFPNGFFYTT